MKTIFEKLKMIQTLDPVNYELLETLPTPRE